MLFRSLFVAPFFLPAEELFAADFVVPDFFAVDFLVLVPSESFAAGSETCAVVKNVRATTCWRARSARRSPAVAACGVGTRNDTRCRTRRESMEGER